MRIVIKKFSKELWEKWAWIILPIIDVMFQVLGKVDQREVWGRKSISVRWVLWSVKWHEWEDIENLGVADEWVIFLLLWKPCICSSMDLPAMTQPLPLRWLSIPLILSVFHDFITSAFHSFYLLMRSFFCLGYLTSALNTCSQFLFVLFCNLYWDFSKKNSNQFRIALPGKLPFYQPQDRCLMS